jgi:hypothetical protein
VRGCQIAGISENQSTNAVGNHSMARGNDLGHQLGYGNNL